MSEKNNNGKNKILVLGGGVAGSSAAHFLSKKGYDVTVIEKLGKCGGLSRTYRYAGHPYEFGPHVWFWPDDEINNVIRELSDDELYYIDRKLFTFVEQDNKKYRYPIHFSDIKDMPDKEEVMKQLQKHRDPDMKLKPEELPTIGDCFFGEYFKAAIGDGLYNKFMRNYTWKMWNIDGDKLKTSMVWADRFKHHYEKLKGYDPLKFEDHTLGKGIKFQVYPKRGWDHIWDRMVENSNVIHDEVDRIIDEKRPYLLTKKGDKYYFDEYHTVINTLHVDLIWGEDVLPATGRMMIPLLIPGCKKAFPEDAESLHYSSCEFQTRVTEMKVITRHESPDTLILIEVPITNDMKESCFPENAMNYALDNNLFCRRTYCQQSEEALALHKKFVDKGSHIKNLVHCGRYAEFKYWGMPETVNSAYQLSKKFEEVK
ncbi:NAD(P)-binding protein [Candidatus Woesearchaeota archaeon]|nr:NAD(P)-binding protein [Candidatus Woesearchaeota archaeon]